VAKVDTREGSQLFIEVSINNQKIRVLVDLVATFNTITPYTIVQASVSLKPKKESYKLILIDREPYSHNNSWITKKIVSIIIKIQDY